MTPPSAHELRCGSPVLCPNPIALRAGPITCRYEEGDLRDIAVAGVPFVQRLYIGVRDHRWATIPGSITDTSIDVQPRSFRVSYTARHQQDAVDVQRRMVLIGGEDGTITCSLDAEILHDFSSNRLGFCVLHPTPHLAGSEVTVIHSDGSHEQGCFPQAMTPNQPFTDITAIRQTISPGCAYEIAFSGDIFEMEDQRPYADASFKTYSRAQARQKPMRLTAGMNCQQAVTIRLLGTPSAAATASDGPVVRIGGALGPALPRIGLGLPHGRLNDVQRALIAALRPAHLQVTLDGATDWPDHLSAAASEARNARCGLIVVFRIDDGSLSALGDLADRVHQIHAPVTSWVIVPRDDSVSTDAMITEARALLSPVNPQALIGGGTLGYAQHLLAAPLPLGLDLVSVPIHPQVHATDTTSLFDNLMSHGEIVTHLLAHIAPAQLLLGPITIVPQHSPRPSDPRPWSLAAAAWTCASISHMARARLTSGTWSHTHGPLGVLVHDDSASSSRGIVTPVYVLLAALSDYAGGTTLEAETSSPTTIAVLAVTVHGHRRILIANLAPHTQDVRVLGCTGDWRIVALDETCAWAAMRDTTQWCAAPGIACPSRDGALAVRLRPYALARLDPA